MTTTFSNKASILADLWMNYRDDEEFVDFVEYNDLGLPLAYALSAGVIEESDKVARFIEETFDLLLSGLGIQDDYGFENLDDLFEIAVTDD